MKSYVLIILFLSILIMFIGMSSCQKGNQTNTTTQTEDSVVKEKLVVAGTGANQLLVKALANKFMELNKNIEVDVPDSIGSGGGIREVTAKRIDIARVARLLKEKEKQDGLIYKGFALSPIVFASSTDITVKNIKRTDIYKIYSGEIRNWKEIGGKDQEIMLIGREPGDSSLSVIEKKFGKLEYNKDLILITTKDQEMITALKENQGAIGFGTLSNMKKEGLNVFTLDNIDPVSKKFPLAGEFGFVYWEAELKYASKTFIDFVFSTEGGNVITAEYSIPIR